MRFTFIVALIAMAMLFLTLWNLELTNKSTGDKLRKLRRRLEPAVEEDPPEQVAEPLGAVN
jgi:hypothetical protein